MSEQRRNLAVGLTVLVSLGLLGILVMRFAGMPALFQRGYHVRIQLDATHEVHEGDPVHLAGMVVGRITDIGFTDNDPRKGVTMLARIESDIHVPADVACQIFGGALKSAYVDLKPTGKYPPDPRTGKPLDFLPKDQVLTIPGEAKGNGLIPDELIDAVKSLKKLSDAVSNMLGVPGEGAPAPAPATGAATASAPAGPPGLPGTLAKLDRALDALTAVMGDAQNQANLKASLANLAQVSGSAIDLMKDLKAVVGNTDQFIQTAQGVATRAGDDLHNLTQKLMTDAEHISQLMTALGKTTDKLNSCEGTMGKLLNDPELYNSLLELTQGLNGLTKDFSALVKQWKEKGVNLKL